jgi:hypothetical protein
VDTRDEVKAHDPALAKLLAEVYGDGPWRYQRPAARPAADRAHLDDLDLAKLPRFRWPNRAASPEQLGEKLAWIKPEELPRASPHASGEATSIAFVNRRRGPVEIDWIDFAGRRKNYATVRPGLSELLNTYPGHVWVVSENGVELGGVAAGAGIGRAIIKQQGDSP